MGAAQCQSQGRNAVNIMSADFKPHYVEAFDDGAHDNGAINPASRTYLLGEMLASAISRGGLHDGRLWSHWLQAIDRWVMIDGSQLSVDMLVDDQPVRWFADPVTALLIVRWKQAELRVPEDAGPGECLAAYGQIEDADDEFGKRQLIEKAVHGWSMRLPGMLAAYAQGDLPGASVSRESWLRVLYGDVTPDEVLEPVGRVQKKVPRQEKTVLEQGMSHELDAVTPHWPQTQKQIAQKRIKRKTREEALRLLRAIPEQEIRLQKIFAAWCHFALTMERGRGGKGYAAGTVKKYLHRLIWLFDQWDYDTDPVAIPSIQLERHVKSYLSKVLNAAERNNAINAFQSFERFRSDQREEEETIHCDLEEFRSENHASPGLLLPDEYARIIRLFDKEEMYALLVILLFRTGLRVEEAVGLRCGDFASAGGRHELFLEKNEGRGLKTQGSRRIIPLDILLEPDELSRLQSHLNKQKAACGHTRDGWLFAEANAMTAPNPAVARAAIAYGLKKVASRKLTHHHLRHSFASYLLATLMLPADMLDPPVPRRLNSVISPQRRERVADRLLGLERLGGNALHAVSQAMGHTGPDTTLRYYVHLLDWLLGLYISRPSSFDAIGSERLCALAGVGPDAVRKARKRLKAPDALDIALPNRPSPGQLFASIPVTVSNGADIHLLQLALRRSAKSLPLNFAKRSAKPVDHAFQQPPSVAHQASKAKTIKSKRAIGCWLAPHAVPVRSMIDLLSGNVNAVRGRQVHWRRASDHLLPVGFWQDKGERMLRVAAHPAYLKLVEDWLTLMRQVGARETRILKSAVASMVRNQRSSEFLFRKLKEGEFFVHMLLTAIGLEEKDIELRHTRNSTPRYGSNQLHRFLKNRSEIPQFKGRDGWRGSLAVRIRHAEAKSILGDRAFRLAITLLAIHAHAIEMERKASIAPMIAKKRLGT